MSFEDGGRGGIEEGRAQGCAVKGVRFREEVLGLGLGLALLMIDVGRVNSCQDMSKWEVFTITCV